MCRVIRRALGLVGVVTLLLAVAPVGVAQAPEGPRLAIVVGDHAKEVVTTGPLGEDLRQLVDPDYVGPGYRPSWSADGSRLAFTANVYPDDDPVLGVVDADGGNLRMFPRARLEFGEQVIAPDGRSIAFARLEFVKMRPGKNYLAKSSIWSFDLGNRSVRRLTRWRLADLLIPSSYSPDGSTLAATSLSSKGLRAVSVDLASGHTSLLAREALEPVYSPDGFQLRLRALERLEAERYRQAGHSAH
jgi:Tol biopolymer transport system component